MKNYCINLPERTDRKALAKKNFEEMGLTVEFFPAIRKKPGWQGCRDSHLAVLDMCKDEQSFAIFEDDVYFMPRARVNLANAMSYLPGEGEFSNGAWDMLYLGCNPTEKLEPYNDLLFRVKKALTTHAIIYNNPAMVKQILADASNIRKIDVYFAEVIQPKYKCFVCSPLVASQYNGKSDVCNSPVLYFDTITQNFNKYTDRSW